MQFRWETDFFPKSPVLFFPFFASEGHLKTARPFINSDIAGFGYTQFVPSRRDG